MLASVFHNASGGRLKLGWWSSPWRSLQSPVIIGGCGRSGTTLLRAALNAHPRIAIGPETGVFSGNRDIGALARSTGLSPAVIADAYRGSSCLGKFAQRLCSEALNPEGKARWGEKSPSNVRNLEVMFRFFPRARFIHVIRDGRDVVASLRTHPRYRWEDGRRVETDIVNPWDACIDRWVRDTRAGLAWRADDRVKEVRYEELVASPREVLGELLEWLGEPWDEAVLDFHRTHRETGSDRANPGVKQGIYRTARGRWTRDLPPEARLLFRPRAARLLVQLGYAPDAGWIEEAAGDPTPSPNSPGTSHHPRPSEGGNGTHEAPGIPRAAVVRALPGRMR